MVALTKNFLSSQPSLPCSASIGCLLHSSSGFEPTAWFQNLEASLRSHAVQTPIGVQLVKQTKKGTWEPQNTVQSLRVLWVLAGTKHLFSWWPPQKITSPLNVHSPHTAKPKLPLDSRDTVMVSEHQTSKALNARVLAPSPGRAPHREQERGAPRHGKPEPRPQLCRGTDEELCPQRPGAPLCEEPSGNHAAIALPAD